MMETKNKRLIFLINAFNEAKHIEKCINSIHEVADEIWIFDGAYANYPHESCSSTDGMIQKVKKFPKVRFFNCKKAYDSQIAKRTAMFANGKPGDMFFVLDGDEYIMNPEEIRNYLDCDVGWVWTVSNLYFAPYMKARLFKYIPGMHYAGRHHWLFDGNNEFVTSDQRMNQNYHHIDTPIRIFNYRESSNPNRIVDRKVFLKKRSEVEERSYLTEEDVYGLDFSNVFQHKLTAGKPERMLEVLKFDDDIDYTFSLMFSRPWAVKRYFEHFKQVTIPPKTELICVIDGDDQQFIDSVLKGIKAMPFCAIRYYVTHRPKLGEFKSILERRQRIVDNWYVILTNARGEILLASEDDSLPQKDAYIKLIADLKDNQSDFVQANIIGRWKANLFPAWQVEEKDGQPIRLSSGKEKTGLEEICGCGWYCFAARTDVCRKYDMKLDDLLPLGADIRFGYELKRHGYKLLHNWDIPVEHFGENFSLLPGRDQGEVFVWQKDGGWFEIKN